MTRSRSFEDILTREEAKFSTKRDLRILGYSVSSNKSLFITEESRPHIHIIGSTQEGKSKFIERLIRGDIKRGIGLCLLDPTAGGRTAYDVFRYCCYKGIKKVCLIDPFHRYDFRKLPGIQPFLYTKEGAKNDRLKAYSIQDILDTMRILFNVKDPADTPRLERYLNSVLSILYDSKSLIAEARYFANKLHLDEREERLAQSKDSQAKSDITEAFHNHLASAQYQSTVNRIIRFYRGTLGLMFSAEKGIDFMKLVAEDWIILVNLDTGSGFDAMDARLLGTYIINAVITAKERLNRRVKDPKKFKPYYLYVDEAAEFANRKMARILSLKQKTGLRMTLAHQYKAQFEDKYVWDAVMANCKLTAMFNVTMREDRDALSKQFYGGDIDPKDASDANADLPKQYAVIKPLKGSPVRVRIPDVEEPLVTEEELKEYTLNLLSDQPWYQDADELKKKLEYETPRPPRADLKTPRPGTQTNSSPNRQTGVPNKPNNTSKWKDVS